MFHVLVTAIILATLALIILLLYKELEQKRYSQKSSTQKPRDEAETGTKTRLTQCILCAQPLNKGEKMISKEIKRKDDSIIYMHGCPKCAHNSKAIRRCPVCKELLKEKEFLVGRMWHRSKTKKMHLHIAGCPRCSKLSRP